jgi:hypothetical protein
MRCTTISHRPTGLHAIAMLGAPLWLLAALAGCAGSSTVKADGAPVSLRDLSTATDRAAPSELFVGRPDQGPTYPDLGALPENAHKVQVLHIVPADRSIDPAYAAALSKGVAHLQIWLRDQLGGHRSFTLAGEPVRQLHSARSEAWFSSNDPEGADPPEQWWQLNVRAEVKALASAAPEDEDTFWLVYVEASARCDQLGSTVVGHMAMYGLKDLQGIAGKPLPAVCPGAKPDSENVCRYVGGMAVWMFYGLGGGAMWKDFKGYPNPLDAPTKAALAASPFFAPIRLPLQLPSC